MTIFARSITKEFTRISLAVIAVLVGIMVVQQLAFYLKQASTGGVEPEAFLARLPAVRQLPSGSAIKFCRVAEGVADLYPRLATTNEWDVAAGHAVLTAAGGIVTAATGGELTYGHAAAGYVVHGFVAWGDPSAAARLGLLNPAAQGARVS